MIALAVSVAALMAVGLRLRHAFGAPDASPDASRATAVVRGALWAFALLVGVEALLGAAGRLTARNVAVALSLFAAAVLAWRPRRPVPTDLARAPLSAVESALVAALGAALVLLLWTGLHKTEFLYDTLSYHLHTPATWMHAHRLEIVPAVFGDPAPAYAPSNIELWFLFLLAPLRSDYLAGSGQLPFAALAAAAIVASVREAGGSRTAALGAGLAFLLIPEVWEQAATAMVDVGMAALLLASLPFARRAELATCAAALGLALGTKYVALVLALPFVAFAVVTAARRPGSVTPRRLVAVVAIVLATGGFWYLRNAVVTGNPVFPGAVPGLALPALYDGAAMRNWDYHLPIGRPLGLASILAGAGVGFATATGVAFARRRRTAELAIFLAEVALFWFVVPYQASRFAFAAFGVAAIAIGRAADRPPAALGWGALAAAIGGALIEIPTGARLLLVPAAMLGACAPAAARRLSPTWLVALGLGGALGLVATVVSGFGAYLARDPGYGPAEWSWVRANVRDARLAYTGANVEFPLTGERVGNRVMYVNVAGEPDDRLHDFARRAPGQRSSSAEPAPYRDGASFDVWWRNLRAAQAEILFVARLHPIVLRSIAADGDGFPVERRWADEHKERFVLRYASSEARVYAIRDAPPLSVPHIFEPAR